jgi:hypothetical protein
MTSPEEQRPRPPRRRREEDWVPPSAFERSQQEKHRVIDGVYAIELRSGGVFSGDANLDVKESTAFFPTTKGTLKVSVRVEGSKRGNLRPFDRLVLEAMLQIWHDQGRDPLGIIAFSLSELCRRMGRTPENTLPSLKDSIRRLRDCAIHICKEYATAEDEDLEEDELASQLSDQAWGILDRYVLRSSRTKAGRFTNRCVAQLAKEVLSNVGGVQLDIQAMRLLKRSHAIVLHGHLSARLEVGKAMRVSYADLATELQLSYRYQSQQVRAILPALEELEENAVIAIAEPRGSARRKAADLTLTLLPPGESPTRYAVERAGPLKGLEKDLVDRWEGYRKLYGVSLEDHCDFEKHDSRSLWFILDLFGDKMKGGEIRKRPENFLVGLLRNGVDVPPWYRTPKEVAREKEQEVAARERERRQRQERVQAREALLEARRQALPARVRELEDAVVQERAGERRGRIGRRAGAKASAPLPERWEGITPYTLREVIEPELRQRLLHDWAKELYTERVPEAEREAFAEAIRGETRAALERNGMAAGEVRASSEIFQTESAWQVIERFSPRDAPASGDGSAGGGEDEDDRNLLLFQM